MSKLSVKAILILLTMSLSTYGQDQSIRVVDFNGLEPLLNRSGDSVYIINFWATWCVPCVKEMPDFQKVVEKYKDDKVSFLFVSVDLPSTVETRLIPFIQDHGITSRVILLDDPNSNAWIDKVDNSWSGSIPATLIYTSHTRGFYEKAFRFSELDSIVQTKLNKL